jgi:hypothetical protein
LKQAFHEVIGHSLDFKEIVDDDQATEPVYKFAALLLLTKKYPVGIKWAE